MSFENLSTKQLRERMRFLSDKIESIWEGLIPKLKEIDECKKEFADLLEELKARDASS